MTDKEQVKKLPKIEQQWTIAAMKLLNGRTIKGCRYLTEKEAKDTLWDSRPLAIFLDDGTVLFPSKDDEGNDGGALFTTNDDLPVIPVISGQ